MENNKILSGQLNRPVNLPTFQLDPLVILRTNFTEQLSYLQRALVF